MMVIRPVRQSDLASLMNLSRAAGVGMTSLPANEDLIYRRISRSELSFSGDLDKVDCGYVLVLEDTNTGQIAGLSGVEAALGLKTPWYNYRIGRVVHASDEIGTYSQHDVLFLSNDHTGYSELCSLFLDPNYRINRNGSLLSKARFMLMAEFQHLFAEVCVAEMRGFSDESGRSPFWESLGRHFFSMDFAKADYLSGVGSKAFIAELMPKFPIYTEFLSPEARAVIGVPHDKTRPALALLESEGFRCEHYVDIFDGGPTIQSYITNIRAVKESQHRMAEVADPVQTPSKDVYLVSNTQLENFRVILAYPEVGTHTVTLCPNELEALQVSRGESLRIVKLNPRSLLV